MPRPGYSARLVPLDALGHAVLPSPGEMAPRLVLATGTGTGKTRAIAAAVAAHPFRVVAISPTIALAHAMGQRLGLRVVGATDRAPGPNESAVICFAGLQRIGVGALPDVTLFNTMLVIDEVESCLSQLLSMLKKGDGTAIYNKLVRMVGYAGRVILSDAHFGAAARRLLLDVDADRESRGDSRLVWDHIRTEPHRHLFRVIRPRFSESGRTTESAGAIHEAVIADRVARGLRLAIYVPGRRRALAFAAVLSERFPSRTVRCVVRPRCEEDKPDLSADSLLVDVLVYNNAMSTGVSIDADGWYDERHILLGSAAAVVDGPMIEQASHRVRRPKREEIWISGGTGNAPPAGDWRYNADDHLRRGLERVFSAEDVSNRVRGTRIQLAGDENCSAESLRMARMQAEVLAARYRHGWRWAAEWLSARHEWSDAGIGGLDSLGDAVAVEQERQGYAEAWSVAASAPLDPRAAKKYDDSGVLPPDALTADALSSARLDALYGEASKGATLHDRADLYLADRRGLYRQCQVFAAMEIVAAADPVAVAALRQWDARMIRQSTVTLARPVLPVAVAIAAALNAVVGLDDILPEVAGAALRRIEWLSTAAALPPGESERPIADLGMLLARAGIRLTGRRVGPRGARRRAYRVDHASIEAMRLRAATVRSSIMSVEPLERLETA